MKQMITILGPTASGKTPVATRLAAIIGGEVISADSRQVYRKMDIGTGKDLEDYVIGSQETGVGSQETGVGSQESGVRSQESGESFPII